LYSLLKIDRLLKKKFMIVIKKLKEQNILIKYLIYSYLILNN